MQVSDISRGVEPHNRIRIVVPLGLGKVFTLPLSRLRLIGPGPVRVPIKRLLVDSTEPINLLAGRGSLAERGSSHAAAASAVPTCVSHIRTNDELDNPAKPSRPPAAGTSTVPGSPSPGIAGGASMYERRCASPTKWYRMIALMSVRKYMLPLTTVVAMSCMRAAAAAVCGGTDAVAVQILVAEL